MAVTFTSYGYDTTTGNPYTELAWATAHPLIGSARYGVRSAGDWAVSAVPNADRTVSIAPGFGFGSGVTDQTVENETIQLDTISSGSRWDLIVARRDWTPTAGETKFMKINGGSTKAIPGGRLLTPGGIDDQPLALVQVTAGQTQPTAIVDLRCFANNGGVTANDELVKGYLNQVGTELYINGVEWRYIVGANNVPQWIAANDITTHTPLGATGWSVTGDIISEPAGTKRRVTVDVTVKRTGAAFTLDATEWEPCAPVIPVALQSVGQVKYLPVVITGGGNHILASAALNPAGALTVRSVEGSHAWNTNALISINVTYYI
jgi:hypothetical protein